MKTHYSKWSKQASWLLFNCSPHSVGPLSQNFSPTCWESLASYFSLESVVQTGDSKQWDIWTFVGPFLQWLFSFFFSLYIIDVSMWLTLLMALLFFFCLIACCNIYKGTVLSPPLIIILTCTEAPSFYFFSPLHQPFFWISCNLQLGDDKYKWIQV